MIVRNVWHRVALAMGVGLVMLCLAGGGLTAEEGDTPVSPGDANRAGLPRGASPGACQPLPPPTGHTIEVYPSQVGQLRQIIQNATSGDTILLHDGTYALNGEYLWFATPNVTLRSYSGNREAVVLDGNYATTDVVTIRASNVTIADVTIQHCYNHPIHIYPPESADISGPLIHNVHIIDPGEQGIKVNPYNGHWVDAGTVACCTIELTDAGRGHIRNNCYTGGIDVHSGRDWVVRDNTISGFWCASGLSEHAIHFWRGCRDTLIERNTLLDNVRGIGLGLGSDDGGRTYADDPCPGATGYVGQYGGVIRNNLIFQGRAEMHASEYGFDCGVCLAQACDIDVVHNTVFSTLTPFNSIEWRFRNTSAQVVNNLVSHDLMPRDAGGATEVSNVEGATANLFVDAAGGDLHLVETASAALSKGAWLSAGRCDDDVDGQPRPMGAGRDVGGDEYFEGSHVVNIPLVMGWNLTSLAVVPDDTDPGVVLASIAGDYDLVTTYDAAGDTWLTYDPASPGAATLSAIDQATPFWIHMLRAATLSAFGGVPGTTDQPLVVGWNLVAYPTSASRGVETALASISGHYGLVWGHDAALSTPWRVHDVAAPEWANTLAALDTGYAYWVQADDACTLRITY